MDKTACVVGASGGIGAATVDRLSKAGYSKVLRMDLDGPIRVDLAEPSSVETAFDEARRLAPRLDALVVASGILDLEKLVWQSFESPLFARREHVAAYDPTAEAHYVLGGCTSDEVGNFYRMGPPVVTTARLRLERR